MIKGRKEPVWTLRIIQDCILSIINLTFLWGRTFAQIFRKTQPPAYAQSASGAWSQTAWASSRSLQFTVWSRQVSYLVFSPIIWRSLKRAEPGFRSYSLESGKLSAKTSNCVHPQLGLQELEVAIQVEKSYVVNLPLYLAQKLFTGIKRVNTSKA